MNKPTTDEDESSIDGEPMRKYSRKSIATVIETKARIQAQVRFKELELKEREIQLEEARMKMQQEKDMALINILQRFSGKTDDDKENNATESK